MLNFNIKKNVILVLICISAAVFYVRYPTNLQKAKVFDRERNFKVVTDPDGRRMAEARWANGADDVRLLRYPWIYDGSKFGYTFPLFGKDYQDPNVYGPGVGTIDLEALLPNFEAKTDIDDPRFKDGYLGDVIKMEITASNLTVKANSELNGEYAVKSIVERHFNIINSIYFSDSATELDRKKRNLTYQIKADRFGLKHFGPVGNFDDYRDFGTIADIYYQEETPKKRFMKCPAEEIKESFEDPTWHRKAFCEHWYYAHSIRALIKLSYRRIYLKNWQKIEQDTEDFFKKILEIKPLK